MDGDASQYWFRAKRYGYGWGLPSAWQGWAVLTAFLVAVLGPLLLGDGNGGLMSLGAVLVGTPVLLIVCYRKGEPAKWRQGDR